MPEVGQTDLSKLKVLKHYVIAKYLYRADKLDAPDPDRLVITPTPRERLDDNLVLEVISVGPEAAPYIKAGEKILMVRGDLNKIERARHTDPRGGVLTDRIYYLHYKTIIGVVEEE